MARNHQGPYTPHEKNRIILDRAWDHVQSVPYPVSIRWLFYRLLQEGYYSTKGDYNAFKDGPLSEARKRYYKGWKPYTLMDDTRGMILRSHGSHSPQHWLDHLARGLSCSLHKWQGQQQYVMLWFEAKAMASQFSYYADPLDLAPFGGSPSIPFKWDIAKHIEQVAQVYGLPVVVLYFGDYDTKGLDIPQEALNDIGSVCGVDPLT